MVAIPLCSQLKFAVVMSNVNECDIVRNSIHSRWLVSAAYPSNTIVFNVSRETNKKILCQVAGRSVHEWRMNGINFSGGHTNSVEFCTAMFRLPQMTEVLNTFLIEEEKKRT